MTNEQLLNLYKGLESDYSAQEYQQLGLCNLINRYVHEKELGSSVWIKWMSNLNSLKPSVNQFREFYLSEAFDKNGLYWWKPGTRGNEERRNFLSEIIERLETPLQD